MRRRAAKETADDERRRPTASSFLQKPSPTLTDPWFFNEHAHGQVLPDGVCNPRVQQRQATPMFDPRPDASQIHTHISHRQLAQT